MRRLKNAKMKQAGVTEGMTIRSDLMKMTDDDLNALAKEGEALQAKRILTGDDRERLKYINNLLEEAQKIESIFEKAYQENKSRLRSSSDLNGIHLLQIKIMLEFWKQRKLITC